MILPVEMRKLTVVETDTSKTKITINPVDGRVEVKLSLHSTPELNSYAVMLAEEVMRDSTLPPTTMRGKITFHGGFYHAQMQTESKSFSKTYKIARS